MNYLKPIVENSFHVTFQKCWIILPESHMSRQLFDSCPANRRDIEKCFLPKSSTRYSRFTWKKSLLHMCVVCAGGFLQAPHHWEPPAEDGWGAGSLGGHRWQTDQQGSLTGGQHGCTGGQVMDCTFTGVHNDSLLRHNERDHVGKKGYVLFCAASDFWAVTGLMSQ